MNNMLAIASGNTGTDNQLRGMILTYYAEGSGKAPVPVTRDLLLKTADGEIIRSENFSSFEEYRKALDLSIREYLKKGGAIPDFVILPFEHSTKDEEKNVDNLSYLVKEAFQQYGAQVKTIVIASRLYDYKYVDYINVGEHLLTEGDLTLLKSNKNLEERVVRTIGVPSNISRLSIGALCEDLERKSQQEGFENPLNKYKGKKVALFSLGGITADNAIQFGLEDGQRLIQAAQKIKENGYEIVFTNSPRTPNNITDYLCWQCKKLGMDFYNSKKIAQSSQEKENFRFYTGMYEEQFLSQAQQYGNIYPAILKYCTFVVNTHDSFSYTSDSAAIGIPSVVYTGNAIDERRKDCIKLYDVCHEKGYVLNLSEAVKLVQESKSIQTKKMENVATQIIQGLGVGRISMRINSSQNTL